MKIIKKTYQKFGLYFISLNFTYILILKIIKILILYFKIFDILFYLFLK